MWPSVPEDYFRATPLPLQCTRDVCPNQFSYAFAFFNFSLREVKYVTSCSENEWVSLRWSVISERCYCNGGFESSRASGVPGSNDAWLSWAEPTAETSSRWGLNWKVWLSQVLHSLSQAFTNEKRCKSISDIFQSTCHLSLTKHLK